MIKSVFKNKSFPRRRESRIKQPKMKNLDDRLRGHDILDFFARIGYP